MSSITQGRSAHVSVAEIGDSLVGALRPAINHLQENGSSTGEQPLSSVSDNTTGH